ncbi:MAG: hypothetical protein RBT34_01590 [Anaerolineaceae bacterium]|jgi:hypothetical protein|nr:hypothetical protein [Anaerolineaceae bacterium]
MPKIFYTERDVEDLHARGVRMIEVGEDVVLTDLAYESAERLGVRLVQGNEKPPGAPERPYLSQQNAAKKVSLSFNPSQAAPQGGSSQDELKVRVRSAVLARMGNQVDPALLDSILDRVLANLRLK